MNVLLKRKSGSLLAATLSFPCLVIGVAAVSPTARAAPDTVLYSYLTGTDQILQKYAYSGGTQSFTASFTGVTPAAGRRILLTFQARFVSDTDNIGSTEGLLVFLDDKPVEIAQNRLIQISPSNLNTLTGAIRLVNKDALIPGVGYWDEPEKGWRLVYAKAWNSPAAGYGPAPFDFTLDITDLVKSGQTQNLTIRQSGQNFNAIALRNVALVASDGVSPLPTTGQYNIALSNTSTALFLDTSGAVKAVVSGRDGSGNTLNFSYFVNSYFGVPGSPGASWLQLGSAPACGYSTALGGKPVAAPVLARSGNTVSCTVAGKYKVTRLVTLQNGRAQVVDTVKNLSSASIAVPFVHEFATPGASASYNLGTASLAGSTNPLQEYIQQPGRPTAFFPFGAAGILLTGDLIGSPPPGVGDATDKVRAQLLEYCRTDNKGGGLRTEHFILAPGDTEQYVWDVYALPSADEFDYTNRLRADWAVPQATLPGPIYYAEATGLASVVTASNSTLIPWLQQNRPYAITTNGGWKYPQGSISAYGLGVRTPFFKDYRGRIRTAADQVHALATKANVPQLPADVKFFVYNDFYIDGPVRTDPSQTQYLDETPYSASFITQSDNSRFTNEVGPPPSYGIFPFDGQYRTYSSRPTAAANFSTFGYDFVNELFDQIGTGNDSGNVALHADGFFLDTCNGVQPVLQKYLGYAAPFSAEPLDYLVADGVTGAIDPATFAVTNAYLSYAPLYASIFSRNVNASFPTVRNGVPQTTVLQTQNGIGFNVGEVLSIPFQRGAQQLTTPAAFTNYGFTMADLRFLLSYGLIRINTYLGETSDQCDVIGRQYPFTALDLHKGWVRGTERIITALSNAGSGETTRLAGAPTFGWNDAGTFRYRVWKYNADRTLANANPPVLAANAATGALVSVPDGGIAIIERVP